MSQRPITGNEVAADSAPISEQDRNLLAEVERSLDRGRDLRKWWSEHPASRFTTDDPLDDLHGKFDKVFRVMREPETDPRDGYNFGFYDRVPIAGEEQKVIGLFQQMFFDQPKVGRKSDDWNEQLAEFVFKYLLRISDLPQPTLDGGDRKRTVAAYLRPVSMLPEDPDDPSGYSYRQVFYRLSDGSIGKVWDADQRDIADLRRLGGGGEEPDWIVIRLSMQDYALRFQPPALRDFPALAIPLAQVNYVILSKDLIRPGTASADGPRVHSLGYALLQDRTGDHERQSYGPVKFESGYSQIDFCVGDDNRTFTRVLYVVQHPDSVLNLPINPVDWGLAFAERITPQPLRPGFTAFRNIAKRIPATRGFDPFLRFVDLANWLTAGFAASQLGISRDQVEKLMLAENYKIQRDLLLSLQHYWRKVENWKRPQPLGLSDG